MNTLALDIGGANIKAVHRSSAGDVQAWSSPFALCKAPQRLADELAKLISDLPPFDRLVMTTTAELCDCFTTKRQGVRQVLAAVAAVADHRPVQVWTLQGRLVGLDEANRHPLACAAANWHALATHLARTYRQGLSLLIDTGSTTTDIIPLRDGKVITPSQTDTQRLAAGELVYLGAARTPLMALGPTICHQGRSHRVMAEYFASTADVYLLTAEQREQPGHTDTADGQPRTFTCAARRIARMIGADLQMISTEDAVALAHEFAATVGDRITQAIAQVLTSQTPQRVIISGSGSFIAAAAVVRALPGLTVIDLADTLGKEISHAACAYALTKITDT